MMNLFDKVRRQTVGTTNEPRVQSSALSDSPISDFYANRSVLVTGATGFIGKVSNHHLMYTSKY